MLHSPQAGPTEVALFARRSPEVMSLVAFLLCAAAVLLVAVLFPMSDGTPIRLGYVMIGVALAMAAATYAFGDRVRRGVLLAEAAAIVALNSVLVANAHTTGGAIGDTLAYGWLIVWVAVFFPPAAGAFAALIGVGFGLGLLASGLPAMHAPWALVTLASATVGIVMGRVSRVVRRHVATDPLTGTLNRGGLHAAAGRAATRTRRRSEQIMVAVLDLDGFKAVNDRSGHAEGDRLLTEATAAWRRALRSDDLLGRVGGDEFVVIMPRTAPDEAARVLDRLRGVHPVAWSAGVAEWRPGEALEACLERADERLYAAKGVARIGRGETARTRAAALIAAVTASPQGRAPAESEWRSRHEGRMTEARLLRLRAELLDGSAQLHMARSDVDAAQAETVRRLSMAVEFRDMDAGEHTDRIGRLSKMLADAAGLPRDVAELIGYAAPLHDVGKVAVPDAVLLKPGRLTVEERAVIETHPEQGYRLLKDSSSKILEMAATIAWTHHEKWDGSGYPRGIAGEDIPVEGRIVAIVDVYDALITDRVYRPAMSLDRALEVMRDGRGSHFDPLLLDLFLSRVAGKRDSDAMPSRPASAGAGPACRM
jgi:diguanylate cyclase (GGDEF)-like protein